MVSRRQFLAMAAAQMTVRSVRPEDLEMPPSGFADFITPVELFFVRTHVAVPRVEIADWRLKVEGHVSTPLTLSMDDLQKMPPAELVGVLECSGNGRSFYEPPVAGLQWTNGAVGNGRWRGVRLADVLQRAGVKAGAMEVLFDGADVPLGTMADFQRSIPMRKALHRDTLLAYSMNGESLPVKHGFPLRAVVPGWAGSSWVKWVTSVRVLNEPFGGFWMKNAYLHPGKPVAPGTVVPPEAMTPVTSLRVKSVIAGVETAGTRRVVRGAAWSGDGGPVAGVDVSVDQGRSWKPARLGGEATRYGWRLWEFSWMPSDERHTTVLARARDAGGDVQPLAQEWNPSGYLWNAVLAPPAAPDASEVVLSPPAGFRETCVTCHQDDVIRQQRLTRAQWDRELNKMAGWGARVRQEDRETFLDYLVRLAGPR